MRHPTYLATSHPAGLAGGEGEPTDLIEQLDEDALLNTGPEPTIPSLEDLDLEPPY